MRDVELIPADKPTIEVMLYTYEMFVQKRHAAQFLLSISLAFFTIMLSVLLFAIATERDTTVIIVITSISMALTLLSSAFSVYQITRLITATSYIMEDIIKYVSEEVDR